MPRLRQHATLAIAILITVQVAAIQVRLPYGISLTLPAGWRASRVELSPKLAAPHRDTLNATDLREDSTGHIVLFAMPLKLQEEASVEFTIKPTGVSQDQVLRLSESDITEADLQFRKEIETAI